MTITFSPSLLNNRTELEHYLRGEGYLKKIEALSQHPELIEKPTIDRPYYGKFQVFFLSLIAPFIIFTSSLFLGVAIVCNRIGLRRLGAFCDVVFRRGLYTAIGPVLYFDYMRRNIALLTPASNCPQLIGWNTYMHRDIPLDSITDLSIRDMTKTSFFRDHLTRIAMCEEYDKFADRVITIARDKGIWTRFWAIWNLRHSKFIKNYLNDPRKGIEYLRKTFHWPEIQSDVNVLMANIIKRISKIKKTPVDLFSKGYCAGASVFFIYLYHATKDYFSDPTKQVLAIAKQFVHGVPEQGVLLHAFGVPSTQLVKLQEKEGFEIWVIEGEQQKIEAKQKIQRLPAGAYIVSTNNHAFVYLKLLNGNCFIWDSNRGLFENDTIDLYEYMECEYFKNGEKSFAIYRFDPK